MRIGVIGGGVAGLGCAYFLAEDGHQVDVFEQAPALGGLAGCFDFDGLQVEKYYHFVCRDDADLIAMLEALGLSAELEWRPGRMRFFYRGTLYPFGTPWDLLRFRPLSLRARVRFGLNIALSRPAQSWERYEAVTARDWLVRQRGKSIQTRFSLKHLQAELPGIVAEANTLRQSKPTGRMRPKDRPLANDFVSDEAFGEMLLAWFDNLARALLPGRSFYIWGGYANCANYPPALKATGLYFSQAIIWVKEHPVLTRKDFMGNHEWAFYGWREGAGHKFFGPTNAVDVWAVKKVNPQSMVHLTEKPVELAARAIQYSSKPGDNVLDLFGGSGSTLIGAEQTGRRCFVMELDPAYCDVIIERWQTATNQKAVLEADGTPFDEVAANRRTARDE